MSDAALLADSNQNCIPVKEIHADSDFNCRGSFTADKVIELSQDIAARGLVQPIVVRKLWPEEEYLKAKGFQYSLVAGFRRLMAYKANQANVIPATVKDLKTDFDCRDLNAVENLQRENLTFYQEAQSIRHYWIASWSREDVAKRVNKSPGWVQQRYELLEMEPDIQKFAAQGYILASDIRELAKYKGEERIKVANRIRDARKTGKASENRNLMVKLRKKGRPHESKRRHRIEVEELMEDLREYFKQIDRNKMIPLSEIISLQGNTFAHKIMAWSVGNLSNMDLHLELREFFKKFDVSYQMPEFEGMKVNYPR
jgi:ParB family chromosome partitioning protein